MTSILFVVAVMFERVLLYSNIGASKKPRNREEVVIYFLPNSRERGARIS